MMSKIEPSTKKGLRERFLTPIRSRNRTNTPSTATSAPPASANPVNAISTAPASSQSSHLPAVANLGHGASSTSQRLLEAALQRLADQDRITVQKYIPASAGIDIALDEVIETAQAQQQQYQDKRWAFLFGSRTVTLREEADKVVLWLNRFKAVGDVAANVDPLHVGLPWAGVRLLLEVAAASTNQRASLLIGCELALYIGNRLKVYLEFHARLSATRARAIFEEALTQLYTHILGFLARALHLYQSSSTRRFVDALWSDSDIVDFEAQCNKLTARAEVEASNCDRVLFEQHEQRAIQELQRLHSLQDSLDRIETKINLDRLPYAVGAEFDAYGAGSQSCHPNTRVELLQQIQDWAEQADGKLIFWLNGMAGTGKSTISRSIATWSSHQRQKGLDLGASFFFKRGEGDRGSAARFFPTIIRQLTSRLPVLAPLIADAIGAEPSICDKLLGEQFEKLIYRPLQALPGPGHGIPTFLVVVDALDECEEHEHVRTILRLCSRLSQITALRLRLFLTSRPELPIRLGFKNMSGDIHHDVVLHDVPRTVIQHDISTFLEDSFAKIREEYNDDLDAGPGLANDWPGDDNIRILTNLAVPLFIAAATICRFVGDRSEPPQRQLQRFLELQTVGNLSQMAKTYLPVLQQLPMTRSEPGRKDYLYQQFRLIVGTVITLAEPLSVHSLATLLGIPTDVVASNLNPLHSVLQIPKEPQKPVRILHLSFAEFMFDIGLHGQDLTIDQVSTHRMLLLRCLEILSGPTGLRENICGLSHPGQLRKDISLDTIRQFLSPEVQYACQHWVYHAIRGNHLIADDCEVHLFLGNHFLHWLEALSLMGRLSQSIQNLREIQSSISPNHENKEVSALLEDARRFILTNRYLVSLAPLQLYSSALTFSPNGSLVRSRCGRMPRWIHTPPVMPREWNLELQRLEGHIAGIQAVSFSPDGNLLASGSSWGDIRLWDTSTGQEVQKLEGREPHGISALNFLSTGKLLAFDIGLTIRTWDTNTGQETSNTELHNTYGHIIASVFSSNGKLLAVSFSGQRTVVYDTDTYREEHSFERSGFAAAVAFSLDGKLLASETSHSITVWDTQTWQSLLERIPTSLTGAIAFPYGDRLFASTTEVKDESWHHEITLRDTNTGRELQRLSTSLRGPIVMVFSPDGKQVAATTPPPRLYAGHTKIELWDTSTGQKIQSFDEHTGFVNAIVFSPDGKLLASGSDDCTIRLWDAVTRNEMQTLHRPDTSEILTVAFSPNGKLLASAARSGNVQLWGPSTSREVRSLVTLSPGIHRMTFSYDSILLALESFRSGSVHITVWNIGTGEMQTQMLHDSAPSPVWVMIFSYNGKLLAAGSDLEIYLWDTDTKEPIMLSPHVTGTNAMVFSPSGKLLGTSSGSGTICLWDVGTGKQLRLLDTSWRGGIRTLVFSPDDQYLAAIPYGRMVTIWNIHTGTEFQRTELKTHPTSSSKVVFRDDGTALLVDWVAIPLEPGLGLDLNTKGLVGSAWQYQDKIMLGDEWVTYNGHNLLWLPLEYRVSMNAWEVHENTIAIGLASGQVAFIQLDLSRLPF